MSLWNGTPRLDGIRVRVLGSLAPEQLCIARLTPSGLAREAGDVRTSLAL